MELTSHVGTGLCDRTVPDLVSLILYICDTCVYRERQSTLHIQGDPRLSGVENCVREGPGAVVVF